MSTLQAFNGLMSDVAERSILQKSISVMPEIRGRQFDSACHSPIANLLTPHQQSRLRSIAKLVEFCRNGETIFTEGQVTEHVYLVDHGMIRISRCSAKDRRQVIALMLPGDVFGFPEQGSYVNSAHTITRATVFQLPWDQLSALLQKDAQLKTIFLLRMAFDLRQAQKRIMVLGQQNVSQRLVSFLLELMEHADFYDPQDKLLSLPISRYDLGNYLGTSPETVVRIMSQMEKDGLLIRLSPRKLLIPCGEDLSDLLSAPRRNDLPNNSIGNY